ncbi:hypothetical protein [Ideonella sp. BN130291]|uniref:hypothetical protein n=1 Tax=Ideonella sp. BN130291 TaxID=3112940 RepID=UPI002E252440|nr:hypothetical protein [Ideonella sp. BN130291]
MKKVLGLLGVAAACGLCCAVPVGVPLLGGLAASGMGWALGWEAAAVAALVGGVVLLVWARRRQASAARCAPKAASSAGCGCSNTGAAGKRGVA